MKTFRVAVFSPNPGSLYTTTVCDLLLRRGIGITAIFVRRFTWARFRQEFTRDGRRLLKKIWIKLVLRERAYAVDDQDSIVAFRRTHEITARSVADLSRQHGLKIVPCATLNDALVENELRETPPDLVVFTGGGIIRPNILAVSGAGIVNCHSGILPEYRGMDVVEWALLKGDFEQLGCTVHFMDRGLDTGDILRVEKIPVLPSDTAKRIRGRIESRMPAVLVEAVVDYLEGKRLRIPQPPEAGRQYFVMHPELQTRAESKLRSHFAHQAS
jgi:folate-dependent phosphoribosylglycinamide formyltransferase PurN